MLVAMNFDLTNPMHQNTFAQICALASQVGVPMQMNAPMPVATSTPIASAPTTTPKVYDPAVDVQCAWVVDKTKVSYTLADGKYVGQTGVRKTLNARLRDAGATYDTTVKAWKFASSKKAQEFADSTSALVTASEIEDVRAKAQARAEKKAAKAQA